MKRGALDPSLRTKIVEMPGMSISRLTQKVKREIPLTPLHDIFSVILYMGGNDLAEKGMTISEFLNILDEAVMVIREKCPEAELYVTDVIPRRDIKVNAELCSMALMDWAKEHKVTIISVKGGLFGRDFRWDGIHLGEAGTLKVSRAIQAAINLPLSPVPPHLFPAFREEMHHAPASSGYHHGRHRHPYPGSGPPIHYGYGPPPPWMRQPPSWRDVPQRRGNESRPPTRQPPWGRHSTAPLNRQSGEGTEARGAEGGRGPLPNPNPPNSQASAARQQEVNVMQRRAQTRQLSDVKEETPVSSLNVGQLVAFLRAVL
jgi:hypothetical protein